MKGKLIKLDNGKYDLLVESNVEMFKNAKLSLKNCQAIERGYDLDELITAELDKLPYTKHLDDGQYNDGQLVGFELGAYWGFQKALELLGDKKFSEEDMRKAVSRARMCSVIDEYGSVRFHEGDVEIIQSLQQTEWDVEIVTEEVNIGDKYTPDPKPLLDSEGQLILKRK